MRWAKVEGGRGIDHAFLKPRPSYSICGVWSEPGFQPVAKGKRPRKCRLCAHVLQEEEDERLR